MKALGKLLLLPSVLVLLTGCALFNAPEEDSEIIFPMDEYVMGYVFPNQVKKIGRRHYRITETILKKNDYVVDLYMSEAVHPTDRTPEGWPLFHHIKKMVITLHRGRYVIKLPASKFSAANYIDISGGSFSYTPLNPAKQQPFYASLSFRFGTYEQARECAKEQEGRDDKRYLSLYQDSLNVTVGAKGASRVEIELECE